MAVVLSMSNQTAGTGLVLAGLFGFLRYLYYVFIYVRFSHNDTHIVNVKRKDAGKYHDPVSDERIMPTLSANLEEYVSVTENKRGVTLLMSAAHLGKEVEVVRCGNKLYLKRGKFRLLPLLYLGLVAVGVAFIYK